MKDDGFYLIHIWECVQRIESYAFEGKAAFLASNMMQDAIIRNFEIIGEATKHLSPELKQLHPEIQWREMAGFRDVLIHNYMGIDLEEIWNIVENELPQIKSSMKAILVELRLLLQVIFDFKVIAILIQVGCVGCFTSPHTWIRRLLLRTDARKPPDHLLARVCRSAALMAKRLKSI